MSAPDLLSCGAPNIPPYVDSATGKTVYPCDCLWCARCGGHTNTTWFGHFTDQCKVTGQVGSDHLCCPGDCQLMAELREQSSGVQRIAVEHARRRAVERLTGGDAA